MLNVKWAIQANGSWYTLEGFNFTKVTAVGVYFIWCEGDPSTNVRVGSGITGARITAHKGDLTITRHKCRGAMYVTWAEVPEDLIERVEKYLYDMYRPIEGDRYPDVEPLPVNLPGA
jgi:hypothetical protein